MKGLKAAALLGALFYASTASAVLVTMEPDDFAAGTDISNAWASDGITLTTVERGFTDFSITEAPVYSRDSTRAVTGTRDFGFPTGTGTGSLWFNVNESASCYDNPAICATHTTVEDIWRVVRIDFARPVDFVDVLGSFTADPLGIVALDSAGNTVDFCYLAHEIACWSILSLSTDFNTGSVQLSHGVRDISTVIIGGAAGGATVDRIRANVPEPGALALFATGALGLIFRRRVAILSLRT